MVPDPIYSPKKFGIRLVEVCVTVEREERWRNCDRLSPRLCCASSCRMTWKCSLSLAEVAARHDHVHIFFPIAVENLISLVDDSAAKDVSANEEEGVDR